VHSPETEQEGQNLSRRVFVKTVRDSAILLILPQALGCRLFHADEKPSASIIEEAQRPDYQIKFFTAEETATVEVITTLLIPSDERPGAKEARVVDFIDYMLMTSYASQQTFYRDSLLHLNQLCQVRFKRTFTRLAKTDQNEVLAQTERGEITDWQEAGDFFSTIRTHTIEGMFSDPKYHGNAGRVGWQLMGVD
jgi:gluconate 2-dehydrogenase gamma chain